MNPKPRRAGSPRSYITHVVGVQSGADVYPLKLLAAAGADAAAEL